jgi:hypothetical protein
MASVPARFELPPELQDVILSQKCVVFIGSGPSHGCYDPWPDLVNHLCVRCGSPSRVTDGSTGDQFLDAAQDAKTADEMGYYSCLGEHFGRPADRTSLLYGLLLSLPFRCYLTVNIDPLLALGARTARIPCGRVIAYPSLDRREMTNRSINYLHGLVNEGAPPAPGTIVLCRSEFDDAYRPNSNLMNLLVPTLENDPILFVGCRLKEPVMSQVFSICKQNQQVRLKVMAELGRPMSNPPPRFILLQEPDVSGAVSPAQSASMVQKEEAYYREMDITPIWYPGARGDHSALRYAIETVAQLPSIVPDHGWGGR